jgi:ribosomal protein S18 acetylase RimI-like enzyme
MPEWASRRRGRGRAGIYSRMSSCEIRRISSNELDLVEPLWNALREHHSSLAPELGIPRTRQESWLRRRRQYEQWLASPDAFVLLAWRGGKAVGYAMVHTREGSATWPLSERAGEIETLSVLEGERGRGTGTMLLEAVRGELDKLDIEELSLHAMPTNLDAIRFYERHGFGTYALWMRADRERGSPAGAGSLGDRV